MQRDIYVDHDEIAQKVVQMHILLEDVTELRASLGAIPESMAREASSSTADGRPAPIFGPLLNAASAATDRLQKSLDAVAYRVSLDLAILTRMSEEVRQHGEDAARDISAVGGEFAVPMPKPDTSDILYGGTTAADRSTEGVGHLTPLPKPGLTGRSMDPSTDTSSAGVEHVAPLPKPVYAGILRRGTSVTDATTDRTSEGVGDVNPMPKPDTSDIRY